MNHIYQYRIILLFICVIIYNSCVTLNIDKSEYSIVKQIAKKELPMVLDKIPLGNELRYGFNNRNEFQLAEIGNPINYYSINNLELVKSPTITVPVIVNGEYKALASIDYVNDSLHIVDFGANELAKEIQIVQKENTNLSIVGLLRVYEISSDFVIMSKNNGNLFIPLTSAKIYLQSLRLTKIEKYYTQGQITEIIKKT